jgi:DNA-binding transcriptional MerR regulator
MPRALLAPVRDRGRTVPAHRAVIASHADATGRHSVFIDSRRALAVRVDSVPRYRRHPGRVHTSEVAARAGVNPQTLRYYERRGLLPEPKRSTSGYRVYSPQVVQIVRFIKRAQQLGFALDDVATLLHLAAGGPDNSDAAREQATDTIANVEARIEDLQAIRAALARLVATGERPSQCPVPDPAGPRQRHRRIARTGGP